MLTIEQSWDLLTCANFGAQVPEFFWGVQVGALFINFRCASSLLGA